jgi:hypothetical protein
MVVDVLFCDEELIDSNLSKDIDKQRIINKHREYLSLDELKQNASSDPKKKVHKVFFAL